MEAAAPTPSPSAASVQAAPSPPPLPPASNSPTAAAGTTAQRSTSNSPAGGTRSDGGRLSTSSSTASLKALSASTSKRRQGPVYSKAREACMHTTAEFPDVATISAHEVLRLRASGAPILLIDVRLPEEQEVSMIQGAISVDAFEAPANSDAYSPAALSLTTVVPYCTIGYRSGLYARKLKAAGYQHVRNGEGVVMWTHDVGTGLVDARSGEETKRVHVYGPPWRLAAPDYEPVVFGVGNWITSHARGVGRWFASTWRGLTRVSGEIGCVAQPPEGEEKQQQK